MKFSASIALLAIAMASASAQATLGGRESGVAKEAQGQRALNYSAGPARFTASGAAYTRHDLSLPDGGKISEFSDVGGAIFAVSWSTPTMPDLDSLLGKHKASLDAEQERGRASGVRSARSASAIQGDLTFSSTGHLRAYRGQAHLKSLLPQGFNLEELSK